MPSGTAEELLRRLAHDLASTLRPTELDLHIEPARIRRVIPLGWVAPDFEICLRIDDGYAVRYGVVESAPIEPQAVQIADSLQDDIVEGLVRVWPSCPTHTHPATAELRSNEAVWVCPQNGRVISRIGSFGPT
jgi:hypothetical protein